MPADESRPAGGGLRRAHAGGALPMVRKRVPEGEGQTRKTLNLPVLPRPPDLSSTKPRLHPAQERLPFFRGSVLGAWALPLPSRAPLMPPWLWEAELKRERTRSLGDPHPHSRKSYRFLTLKDKYCHFWAIPAVLRGPPAGQRVTGLVEGTAHPWGKFQSYSCTRGWHRAELFLHPDSD